MIRRIGRLLCLLAATAAVAGAAPLASEDPTAPLEPSPGNAVLVGLLSGAAGFTVGALVGAGFSGAGTWDESAAGIIAGSAVGAFTLPLGVHAGNRGQGRLGPVVAASLATGLAGWGAAAALNEDGLVFATPVAQIVACTLVEVGTMDRRPASGAAAADTLAGPDGRAAPTDERVTHDARAAFYGLAAGTAGFTVGALIGASVNDGDGELDGLVSGFIGGSILGAVTLPLGVHAGNAGQGDLGLVIGTSVLTGLIGWTAAATADEGALLLATPVAQLAACTAVEVATTPRGGPAPRREAPVRRRDWDVSLAPIVGARHAGLVVSGRF
ncbi:MAG: hypothetical protein R3D98_01870 [Candidatus Krumholzibacteriia bacterium]